MYTLFVTPHRGENIIGITDQNLSQESVKTSILGFAKLMS